MQWRSRFSSIYSAARYSLTAGFADGALYITGERIP
jgi:hypothetical protein